MFWKFNLRGAVLALGVLLLASGCANNETKSVDDSASATTKASEAEQAQKAALEIPNPSTIAFDKLSVKLDSKTKETIAQMAEKAESSKKLVIWGFCDRKQIGNAVACATERAVAVKKELAANGVKSPHIRIRYNTEKAGAHAAEVWFD